MKCLYAVTFVALGMLVACGDDSKGGSGGNGGAGGDDPTTSGMTTMSTSSTGGMGGAGGAGGGSATCDNSGDCAKCNTCAQMGDCADELMAFKAMPNSAAFEMCIAPCVMNMDPMCGQACCTANQAECAAYNKIAICAICDNCPKDCASQTQMCPMP